MCERAKTTAKTQKHKRENSFLQSRQIKSHRSFINSPVDYILHLQRTIGNQIIQKLLKSRVIHAKLKMGQPGDKYEQQADRMAEQVIHVPDPKVQRQPEEEEELIQTKLVGDTQVQFQGENPEVTPDLESRINSMKGGGEPLSQSERAFFVPRFGKDFSQVRVHKDTGVAETTRAVNAQAFTIGRDVFFGAGQYSPGTPTGKKLLAHELTHVIQQDFHGILGKSSRTLLLRKTDYSKIVPLIMEKLPELLSEFGVKPKLISSIKAKFIKKNRRTIVKRLDNLAGTILDLQKRGKVYVNITIETSSWIDPVEGPFGPSLDIKLISIEVSNKEEKGVVDQRLEPGVTSHYLVKKEIASIPLEKILGSTRYYIVKKGDNLWKIAKEQLGRGSRWKEILALNPKLPMRKKRGKRIVIINENQALQIPVK